MFENIFYKVCDRICKRFCLNPQIPQSEIAIPPPAKDNSQREKRSYICGLRKRIECDPLREYSTHSDRVTNIGFLLSLGGSTLPAAVTISAK